MDQTTHRESRITNQEPRTTNHESRTNGHPLDYLLRTDRLPHIWCPGCGIGVALKSLLMALEELETPLDEVAMVSGIGCTARAIGYVKFDAFHTTHGRAIPFATGLTPSSLARMIEKSRGTSAGSAPRSLHIRATEDR